MTPCTDKSNVKSVLKKNQFDCIKGDQSRAAEAQQVETFSGSNTQFETKDRRPFMAYCIILPHAMKYIVFDRFTVLQILRER